MISKEKINIILHILTEKYNEDKWTTVKSNFYRTS